MGFEKVSLRAIRWVIQTVYHSASPLTAKLMAIQTGNHWEFLLKGYHSGLLTARQKEMLTETT